MKLKLLITSTTALILQISNSAFAVTADNVVCAACVQATDLDNGAVKTSTIRNKAVITSKIADAAITTPKIASGAVKTGTIYNKVVTTPKVADAAITTPKIATGAVKTRTIYNQAVTTPKIADAAVTEAKLSAAVQAKLNGSGVPSYDRPVSTATQKVYVLAGDFTCTEGVPDVEIQDITRASVTGGTRTTITVTQYIGGLGGTKCTEEQKKYYFNNGFATTLYKREKYNGATLTETDEFQDFNETTCSDCGLILRTDGMIPGLVQGSGGMETDSAGLTLGLNTISLQEANTSETINEGELNEETLTGCSSYFEDRTTSYFGTHKSYKVHCNNVGKIQHYRRNANGTYKIWQLTSYTLP